jgi:hypothetical protein
MFKCLRSGECCTQYEVRGVIGYRDGIKPEGVPCKHLIPPKLDPSCNIWRKASCTIHNTSDYPKECEMFIIPGENFNCGLGLSVWRERYHVTDVNTLLD